MTNPCSFVSTYLGMSLSSAWICGLGAAVVSVFPGVDIVVGLKMAGDQVVAGYGGSAVYLAVALGGIVVTGMSLYGSALTTMTGIESLSTIKMTQRVRVILTVGMSVACIPICFIFTNNFQTSLTVFYALLMYALAPWTAINLVDFFFVRRDRASMPPIPR